MTDIILCGGSATRLWPISRTLMPKEFVKFFTAAPGQSLLQRNSPPRSLFNLPVKGNNFANNGRVVFGEIY